MITYIFNKKNWLIAIVLISLMLAGWARFYKLDGKGLWSDELTSASMVLYHPLVPSSQNEWFHRVDGHHINDLDSFWSAKAAEQTPPLFDLVAKAATSLIGPSEIGMRLPSALASSLLLIWFLFQAWKERGKYESGVFLWAAFLSAVSPAFIEYAQEARSYSLGALFSGILCTFWYMRWRVGLAISKLPSWGEIFIFILACYTHYILAVLCAILLGVYMWVAISRKEYRTLAKMMAIPIALIPWLIMNAHTFMASAKGEYSTAVTIDRLDAIGRSLSLLSQLIRPDVIIFVAAIIWLVFAKMLFVKNTSSKSSDFLKPVFALATVILLNILLVSQIIRTSGVWNERFFLFILPASYLFIGIFLNRISRFPWLSLSICAIIILLQINIIHSYYNESKEGYREAAYWLKPRLASESIVITSWEPNRNYYRYYLDQVDKKFKQVSLSHPQEASDLCHRLEKVNDFGVIAHTSHYPVMVKDIIDCNGIFVLEGTVTYPYIIAQHWRRKGRGDSRH